MPSLFQMYARKLAIAIMAIALTIFVWANLILNINTNTNATTVYKISNQTNKKVEKDISTVEGNFAKVIGQTRSVYNLSRREVY